MSEGAAQHRETEANTIRFYTNHPISKAMVLERLRIHGLRVVTPEVVSLHDQDHFGGLNATDNLVGLAQIKPGHKVADFCAGIGGTARYLAYRYGADVTGIELTPSRVKDANELTEIVGLSASVRVLEGNVNATILPDCSVDIVISQEAFCHLPNLSDVIKEAYRILRPGGRTVLTDWIAHAPISQLDCDLLWKGLAIGPLRSIERYRSVLVEAGFVPEVVDDITEEWQPILIARQRMYLQMRDEALVHGIGAGDDDFYASYDRVVDLLQKGVLGGVRIKAVKPERY